MAFWKNRFGPPDISQLKAEQDAGALIDALTYKRDAEVRRDAALTLGELRVRMAADALTVALQEDQDAGVRRAAAIALGRIRPSSAFLPAITALHDADAGVRQASVFLLGQLGNQKATPFLLPFLEVDQWPTRKTTAKALQRLGWQPDESRAAAYYYIVNEQWSACATLGKTAVAPLIAILADPQREAYHPQAIWALGQIGDPQAVQPLAATLRHRRTDIRRVSAEALGKIGGVDVLEPLLSALKDRNEAVQWAAQNGLKELQAVAAVPILAQALTDDDVAVRLMAVELLGGIDDTRVPVVLRRALQDEETRVRLRAAGALPQMSHMDAHALALVDDDPSVRVTALRALRNIDDSHVITL